MNQESVTQIFIDLGIDIEHNFTQQKFPYHFTMEEEEQQAEEEVVIT